MPDLERSAVFQRAAADHEAGAEHRHQHHASEPADERDYGEHDVDHREDHDRDHPESGLLLEEIPALHDPVPAAARGHAATGGDEIPLHPCGIGHRRLRRRIRTGRAHALFSFSLTLTVAMAFATSDPSSFFASASTKLI